MVPTTYWAQEARAQDQHGLLVRRPGVGVPSGVPAMPLMTDLPELQCPPQNMG